MLTLRTAARLAKLTYQEWRTSKPELIGAAIAFYIIFSLGPLLFIIIEIVGLIFGKSVAESQILHEIRALVGEQLAEIVALIITNAETPPTQKLTTLISIPMVLFGSTMVFFQIKNALNYIWGATVYSGGVFGLVRNYLSTFVMVIFLGGLLLFLVIKSFILAMLGHYLFQSFPYRAALMQGFDVFITFFLITFLFAMIYKKLTEPKIRWSDEWIGASVTSLLFTFSQFLINFYFSRIDIGSTFGAVGSLTLLLIWVYYSSLVFLFGAVFTKVYASEYGSLRIDDVTLVQ